MSEENKVVVGRFFQEVWNEGKLHTVDELLAADFVDHRAPAGLPPGPEGTKAFLGSYRNAFPDMQTNIEDQIAERDKVVTRYTVRGTHQGDLVMGNQRIPPSGNRVEVTGINIDRLERGELIESWSEFDALGMMQQLGIIPEPGQADPEEG
jgi:steroid delta-isomerase-like uncharacterized protein